MRKSFKTYLIIWAIALVLFNAVIFLIPSSIDGATIIKIVKIASTLKGGVDNVDVALANVANHLIDNKLVFDKYVGAFWPAYACIMVAFIGQIVCASFAFKETNNQKFFYKISLIKISYTGLIFTLIFGVVGMFFPDFPIWLAVALCVVIFVITLVALLKANLVATIVSDKDDEIAEKTSFVKEMTEKAKALWDLDKQNEELRKLYELFRYANPYTKDENGEITKLFSKIVSSKNDKEKVAELVKQLKDLVK